MKRKLLLLFAFFGFLLIMTSGCRMRYPQGTTYKIHSNPTNTKRHFGARKSIWQRKTIWGRKHYGPRPYGHRGRHRY